MIKDMVAKLEADAAAEGDQKAWCDSEMEKATSKRDENIGNIEGDTAAKSVADSNIVKLKEEIGQLQKEIADAAQGLEGTKKAMKILKDFYDNAFIQTSNKTPTDDDVAKLDSDMSLVSVSQPNTGAASG